MALPVVSYQLDNETVVKFEVDPTSEWYDVGSDQILGKIHDAVSPAIEGARVVLDRVRQAKPDEVEVKFGIKVSGQANWYIARAATEANFEITLKWQASGDDHD